MTVLTDTRKHRIVCDGVATTYNFTLRFNNPLDIKVLVITRATGEYYQLKPNIHATVTFNNDRTGGSIIFDEETKPTNAVDLLVLRTIPLLQKFRLPTESLIDIRHFEHQLDRIAMIATQMQEKLNRAMISSPTATEPAYTLAPQASGHALVWNAEINGFDNSARNGDSDISLASAALVVSIAAEVAAEAAQVLAEAAQAGAEAVAGALSGVTGLTVDEKAALVGTLGEPGDLNRYFTETDPAYISPDTIQGAIISEIAGSDGESLAFRGEWKGEREQVSVAQVSNEVVITTTYQFGGTSSFLLTPLLTNTITFDTHVNITLKSGGVFSIPSGKYFIDGFSFNYSNVLYMRNYLLKSSDNSLLLASTPAWGHPTASDLQMQRIMGIIELEEETDVVWCYFCTNNTPTIGLGIDGYDPLNPSYPWQATKLPVKAIQRQLVIRKI